MNISMSKLFSGDFNSLIFELTRLILAHFVRRGTALSSWGTFPGWPRPSAATGILFNDHAFVLLTPDR